MKKGLLWIMALGLSFVIGQSAFAQGECGENMMKNMMENFKLDESQKAKVKPIMDQLKSAIGASASQMKDMHTQMNQLIQSDSMDQGALDSLIDKKARLIGDMMKAKANAKHQIFMILNPQQKTAYQTKMKQWEDKMAAKWANCHKEEGTVEE